MIVQLRLLSGRARLGSLLRHFSPTSDGICELCQIEIEDLSHFLIPRCPALYERSLLLLYYMATMVNNSTVCKNILDTIVEDSKLDETIYIQFVLDCSVLPQVITAAQSDQTVLPLLFKITRTWCYSLHRTRLKLLDRWCKY